MKNRISFNNAQLEIIRREQSIWLRSTQIGLALRYANPKTAVTKIFNRNKDEFTTQMTAVVKLPDANGDMQNTRIFSLRGAHLIAMFANTPIAKEFRKWVLDILDREVGQPQPVYQPEARDALRYAAGVSSPQHFGVSHIPILAEECQRIYSFTNVLKEVMYDAEKQAVRRVLKNREDADAVVSEMKQLLDETNQSHNLLLTNTLARWQQADIQQFLQRH